MRSFRATKIVHDQNGHNNFESTSKIQSQVYHQIGSLFSLLNADPKFLQIYFTGNEKQRINIRF